MTARSPARVSPARVSPARVSGTSVPEIALRRGYVTAISFTDSTGAPWPIEEALVDRRFLPPGAEGGAADEESGSSHLLYLAPQAAYLSGNAVVKLRGLAEPVVASLRGTGADADFRVEIRLGVPGPNADPGALAQPAAFHAGDPVLLGLLGGSVPPDAERLAVEGGASGDRAWRRGGEVLLLTRAHLLSPGPLAAERGPGGRWAYRLSGTPLVLVSDGGREKRLGFADPRNGCAVGGRRAMRTEPIDTAWRLRALPAIYISVAVAVLSAGGFPWAALAQVPDNRDLKLDPEDSVPPFYRETLDERDRQRLDDGARGGRDLPAHVPGAVLGAGRRNGCADDAAARLRGIPDSGAARGPGARR